MPWWLNPFLDILRALATPIIAAVGVYIALQQKRQGDIRLQIDRYDRRYAIFSGARDLLGSIVREGKFDGQTLVAFLRSTGDAVFITNDDVVTYLNELRLKAIRLGYVGSMADAYDANRDKYLAETSELVIWFSDQYDVLITKFRPLLSYAARRCQ